MKKQTKTQAQKLSHQRTSMAALLALLALLVVAMAPMAALAAKQAGVHVPIKNGTGLAVKVKICGALESGTQRGKAMLCSEYTIKAGQTKKVSCLRLHETSCTAQIHYGGSTSKQELKSGHYYQLTTATLPKRK